MNKLTIIPIDAAIYVDGMGLTGFDLSIVPADIHALQWQENSGWIERKNQPNEAINVLPDWANQCLMLWNNLKAQMDVPVVLVLTDDQKISAIKMQASGLLASSDWTMLNDVGLTNKADWTTYRAALRAIVLKPQLESIIPKLPQEIWK